MCTAIAYYDNGLYFGRTLDHQFSYGEQTVTIPKGFDFGFRRMKNLKSLYEIKGTALMRNSYPLFFDGMNGAGLCMAGLNFSGNSVYYSPEKYEKGVASFEFIAWVLSQNSTVKEAKEKIQDIVILDIPFESSLPSSPLHWIIAGNDGCITVEQTKDGLKIHDNPMGVLTNDPPFDWHMENLRKYVSLSPNEPTNTFSSSLSISSIGLGSGAFGLPGDWSSPSRFVRVTFAKENYIPTEKGGVSDFFSILGTVEQLNGLCRLPNGTFEKTVYKVCYDTEKNEITKI